VDDGLFASASVPRYLDFMRQTLASIRWCVREGGYVCFVIGDVRRGEEQINLAGEVVAHCVKGTGFKVLEMINDALPVERKVSRIWGKTKGRATKVDRILVLGGPAARQMPVVPKIDWAN
jgi:hypothetical protein